jgi:hypothetical protein
MTGLDEAGNTFPKILRIASAHDPPPQTVNHKPALSGSQTIPISDPML